MNEGGSGPGVLMAGMDSGTPAVVSPASRRLLTLVAEGYSHLASPPVMSLVVYLYAAFTLGGTRVWVWSWIHVVLAIIFPVAVLVAMVRRHEVSHIELVKRSQRIMPLLFTLVLTGYSLFLMEVGRAPFLLRQLTQASCLMLVALLLITRYWKISMHAAGVSLTGAFLWKMTGSPFLLIVPASAMAMARLYLHRHTPAQVLAGTILGVLVGLYLT